MGLGGNKNIQAMGLGQDLTLPKTLSMLIKILLKLLIYVNSIQLHECQPDQKMMYWSLVSNHNCLVQKVIQTSTVVDFLHITVALLKCSFFISKLVLCLLELSQFDLLPDLIELIRSVSVYKFLRRKK